MFKNKHVVMAMIIAPILAILAYYLTDLFLSEKPQSAVSGQQYKLAEKSNCRYASGLCDIQNADVEIRLTPGSFDKPSLTILMESNLPLEGSKLAVVKSTNDTQAPQDMQMINDNKTLWSIEIERPNTQEDRLRLVVAIAGSLYYADLSTSFTERDRPKKER